MRYDLSRLPILKGNSVCGERALSLTAAAPPLQPQVEFFSNEVMIHPVTNRPEHKRSFIPSLVEKEKVSKLVHAIKMGWIKPCRVDDDSRGRYYDLWAGEDSSILAKHRMHLPAPKTPLPGHHESYNPPPEYLLTDEEVGGHRWTGLNLMVPESDPGLLFMQMLLSSRKTKNMAFFSN